GRRSVPARLGHRPMGLAGIHSARVPALRPESARGIFDLVEQQAGGAVQVERPAVLLWPGVPEPDARRPHPFPDQCGTDRPRLAHGMFDSASGAAIDNLGLELDDANRMNHIGSAFDDAFYSHPNKDLRRVLGLPEADPLSRAYCGGGNLAACRAVLWHAMDQA